MKGRDEFKVWKWLKCRLGILTKGSENMDLSNTSISGGRIA